VGDAWKWDDRDEVMRYALEEWRAAELEKDTKYAAPNSITMSSGNTEMLRIAEDGFYVRGVRVPADKKEARIVYEAFKAFLVWNELARK